MPVEVKFCGLTRSEDAREAAALGAQWIGAILADGPRLLTPAGARAVFAGAGGGSHRVAVVGGAPPDDVARAAADAGADVVQLHGDPDLTAIGALRQRWTGQVWAVVRVRGASLPEHAFALFDAADAVVLDARVDGRLGGTGVPLDWNAIGGQLADRGGKRARLVLAGGLTPDNVARAVRAMHPDVVDVSSGVESSVGVKDHAKMRAFRDAVLAAAP